MAIRQNVLVSVMFIAAVMICGCLSEKGQGDSLRPSKFDVSVVGEKLVVSCNSVDLLAYQKQPMGNPKGGEKFAGSNFIHPLKTPSGFVLTDLQPDDHLHHFGLWWPWKFLTVNGKKTLYWELQEGAGVIEAQGITSRKEGKGRANFTALSHYIDRTGTQGPEVVLKEKVAVDVTGIVESPVSGYYLDLAITHSCATEAAVEVVKYRYSGFSIRGPACWNKDNSTVLTSGGKERVGSNSTRADWVRVQGDADGGNSAGFVMMSHPENRDTPNLLRTWEDMFNGAIFINFNAVQSTSWHFEPGKEYTQKYRLFIYDGTVSDEQAQKLWLDYSGR